MLLLWVRSAAGLDEILSALFHSFVEGKVGTMMIVSSAVLSAIPAWALLGALWAAVGVFVMSAFTCYAWRRMMAVPGVAEGRADSVRASVACGGVCALVSAVLVTGASLLV